MKEEGNLILRRQFIALAATAGAVLLADPLESWATRDKITVGEIMDAFIAQVPSGPIANTVDTLKSGSRDLIVTGVVTCMFPTVAVIKKAAALGANFIIAHEPTFYNHQDATKWLEQDAVYKYKSALLKRHNIAVWRNHDYIHTVQPDGVRKATVEALGWQKNTLTGTNMYTLNHPLTLKALIAHCKTALGISMVRYVGKLDQPCSKVLLMPGAPGGQRQIEGISTMAPDVLITGEIAEWETAEYVRDAMESGQNRALIILGHIPSEELGAKFMVNWMAKKYPEIKTTFVKTGNIGFM